MVNILHHSFIVLVALVAYYYEFYRRKRKKELFFVPNNKLLPHGSINYRCSQFPKIFRPQLRCAFELIFILKLD